jgi:2-dehydro-3-deoxy-D-arabinonate dehydratase
VHIVRYSAGAGGEPQVGVRDDTAIRPLDGVPTIAALLALSADGIRERVARAATAPVASGPVRLLPPADGRTEIWAAGVTYQRSKTARLEESGGASFYDRVYDADRPELFFKSVPWRVVGDGDPIAIRRDSALNVPEAELAVVVNSAAEIVGYTICDDVSSRTIEAENPLYLPQAKIYAGSCAIAPFIRPAWEVAADALSIRLEITRGGDLAYSGHTDTGQLKRTFGDLVHWLFAEQDFPDGAIISTGTGIVPELDFTLLDGDTVAITIDGIGRLTNHVVTGNTSELRELLTIG